VLHHVYQIGMRFPHVLQTHTCNKIQSDSFNNYLQKLITNEKLTLLKVTNKINTFNNQIYFSIHISSVTHDTVHSTKVNEIQNYLWNYHSYPWNLKLLKISWSKHIKNLCSIPYDMTLIKYRIILVSVLQSKINVPLILKCLSIIY
jgi:hypothetical protein